MKFILIAIGFVATAYISILLLLYFRQENLIFQGSKLSAQYEFRFDNPFKEKVISVAGEAIHSLLFSTPRAKGLILYFHGNAGDLSGWGEVAQELSQRSGMNVWIVDYPGYGKSTGTIRSEAQLHAVAEAMLDAAAKEAGGTEKIFLYGRSIGTGLAVKLASQYKTAGLILESPYFSLVSLVGSVIPWVPTFVLKYKLRSNEWIGNVSGRILIIHGDQDEVIPFAQGQSLAAVNGKANFAAIPGGHHNDLSDYPEYWRIVERYFSQAQL